MERMYNVVAERHYDDNTSISISVKTSDFLLVGCLSLLNVWPSLLYPPKPKQLCMYSHDMVLIKLQSGKALITFS